MKRLYYSSGQAMVEAAIVLPLIIFVIVIIIETALLANAKVILRYAAFCAARCVAVEGNSNIGRIKEAAVIPLLSITRKFMENSSQQALLRDQQFSTVHLKNFIKPGGTWAPAKPFAFNRDMDENLHAAAMRTFVSVSGPANREWQVEVAYFYQPFFPIANLTRMVNSIWEMEPLGAYKQKVENLLSVGKYDDWKKSDLIPLFYQVSIPVQEE